MLPLNEKIRADYKIFITELQTKVQNGFKIKNLNNKLSILTSTIDDYDNVVSFLKGKNIPFHRHTYQTFVNP